MPFTTWQTSRVSLFASSGAVGANSVSAATLLGTFASPRWKTVIERALAAGVSLEASPLACIRWSGCFGLRSLKDPHPHSGLCHLRFAGLEAKLPAIRAKLEKDEHVAACWAGPDGDSLEILCIIPADAARHAEHFDLASAYFKKRLKLTADASGADLTSVGFCSHDPALFTRRNPVAFGLEAGL